MKLEFEVYFKNPTKYFKCSCEIYSNTYFYFTFYLSWYCHFDDDNYLNVERLYQVLKNYDPNEDWYLGRRSTSQKINSYYKNVINNLFFILEFLKLNEQFVILCNFCFVVENLSTLFCHRRSWFLFKPLFVI
jgi:hypothetical protein